MKFIRKPSPPFEAFQWFKLGDGPAGVVRDYSNIGNCPECGKPRADHGHLNNYLVCPGDWIAEVTPGEWKRFTPAAFEAFCIPVVDVENWIFKGLGNLGFTGLESKES